MASTTTGSRGSTQDDVARLLQDEGIVRHRGKIEAVINNAQRAIELANSEGSLAAYFLAVRASAGRACRAANGLDIGRVYRTLEGVEEARLEVRRPDDHVCLYAGDGTRQRSCRGLHRAQRG
ncbi:DNA-3-methyladenine glycosylase I [Thauera humireducens]|uniref:DNA-3-methyladenine glycosylase I n=1 Tax=Thauera humireducens TaxID=1134435 RepID=UPI003C74D544